VLQGGLILASLAIVATVTLIIVNSIPSPRPGPRNMLSDGITIGANFEAVSTPALEAGDEPVETEQAPDSDAIAIEIYADYLCPACAVFAETNDERVSTLLEQGAVTVEIHPLAIFDGRSVGTNYSTRAANAAACVANYSPNSFFQFNRLMFANQPPEQEKGLTDDELVAITEEADVSRAAVIRTCIEDLRFESWVEAATERATVERDLLDDSGQAIFVNGERYQGALDDATAFAQFTAGADAAASSQKSAASPSPAP
jgi:hypothetical protein